MRDNSIYCGNEANMQWLSFTTYQQIIPILSKKKKKEKNNEMEIVKL